VTKPIVAIVGRPNVGKSTLFNRLTGGRTAIVEDMPGVTRDRLYRDSEWLGRNFTLVDTGGIDFTDKEETSILAQVRKQAQIAVDEADVIIFMADGRTGLTADDENVGIMLRRSKKPVLLVVNKVEDYTNNNAIIDFYQLGLGEPLPISAANAMNIGDLLDQVIAFFPNAYEDEEPDIIKIAVVGRPNVGKSSLVNIILGQERVIVSDIAGTTRDAIDTPFTREGQKYLLIDTAGIRRKSNIELDLERYSVMRSLRAIERSDVVLMIIDATTGVTEQDKRIAGYVHEAGKGSVLVINKWDLVEKDEKTMNKYEETVHSELGFMRYTPTLFVSALTKQRVVKIVELVNFVAEQQTIRINTSILNDTISDAVQLTPPPTDKGKRLKIMYCTQASIKPPNFIFFVNDPELMHFSYLRYLENTIRKNFGFEGSPIRMTVRKRDE